MQILQKLDIILGGGLDHFLPQTIEAASELGYNIIHNKSQLGRSALFVIDEEKLQIYLYLDYLGKKEWLTK